MSQICALMRRPSCRRTIFEENSTPTVGAMFLVWSVPDFTNR